MKIDSLRLSSLATLVLSSVCLMFCCAAAAVGEDSVDPASAATAVDHGARAALDFERGFREPADQQRAQPIRLEACRNITKLSSEFWSKKHVLTDFKKHRTQDQVGVIVFVKTEYCCEGSRLCAVTTACLEKKSTPLVGRFRVYAAWIKNDPDFPEYDRHQWDARVIREYDFVQGPGARVVVMVPTWDGKMYQWHSDATQLDLDGSDFVAREGTTPQLERFLQTAVDFAPAAPETETVVATPTDDAAPADDDAPQDRPATDTAAAGQLSTD